MTIVIPDYIQTQKKNVWQWLPAVANPLTGPTVAEWTAGIATQIHYETSQMQYTSSLDTGELHRYSNRYSTTTEGQKKIEFPDVEVLTDPQAPDSTTYALTAAWVSEPTGYLALRAGLDDSTAAAAAQNVSLLVKVKVVDMTLKAPNPGESNDHYRRVFKILPQDDPITDVKIAA